MANVLNKATKEFKRSVNTPDYSTSDNIINPDLSAVDGYPSKYWTIDGDNVTLMSQVDRDAVDAAERTNQRDKKVEQLEDNEDLLRATSLRVIDEFERYSIAYNSLLDAIQNATSLSDLQSTVYNLERMDVPEIAELLADVRSKLGEEV